MKNRQTDPKSLTFDSLKKPAKEFLDKNSPAAKEISNHDVRNLIEDLQIHQMELKMQNEELSRAQQELEALRDRYVDLYDFAPVGYFTISEKGMFLEANLTGASALGTERGSLIGKPFSDYLCREDQDIFHLHRKKLSETGTRQTCELTLLRKDGSQFHARLESMGGRDSEGNFNQFRVSVSDITERRRAQDALQEAHDEMERQVEERTAQLVDANRRLSLQVEECRLAEEALRDSGEALVESEERLNKILTKLPDIVYLLDPDGAVNFVSHAVTKYGYSPEDLIGVDILELVHPEDRERVRYGVKERRTGERSTKSLEIRLLPGGEPDREGAERTFLLSAEGLYAGNGGAGRKNFLGTQGIARDISEHKEGLEEKHRLEAQLHQAQKMGAIGTLAGGIAHDFNNLLMGMNGNISLMRHRMDPSQPDYKRLLEIESQIRRGAELTSRLLGFARKGRYEIKPTDLNHLVEETARTFERTRKNITVHKMLTEDLLGIMAEPVQIEQVLFNLFINAADAMPGGGDLTLKTKNTTHESIKGTAYEPRPGNYVQLEVSDTGTGMDADIRSHIFEPFFTTKEVGHGTGLGLASVYGIIKGHGGYIEVHSKKGTGTTFQIYLPGSAEKVVEEGKPEEFFVEATGTVLLVDDEKAVLEVTREMLEAIGHQVKTATNGKEAIEVYRKYQNDIDMVILDMIMPNGSGGETFDSLKQINPNIKVLLSSGYSIEGKAREIMDRGCSGFMQKPYELGKLSRTISEILEEG